MTWSTYESLWAYSTQRIRWTSTGLSSTRTMVSGRVAGVSMSGTALWKLSEPATRELEAGGAGEHPAQRLHEAPVWLSSRKYPTMILQTFLVRLLSPFCKCKWYANPAGRKMREEQRREWCSTRAPRAAHASF